MRALSTEYEPRVLPNRIHTMLGVAMKTMLLLIAILISAALVTPAAAQTANKAGIRAKCMQEYPDSGTTQDRRRNAAMRRQCIASGGKM